MRSRRALTVLLSLAAAVAAVPSTASAGDRGSAPVVSELASFAAPGCTGGCGSGSTIGPDGALYVTDGPGGRVLRVDPATGSLTTFASGLPPATAAVGIGGAMDVAFLDGTAYVLVTLVGPSFGQPGVVDGIYRIAKDGTPTPIADIGAWSIAHPPATDFFVDSGVQYALEVLDGDFIVTDGHHNRVLRVTRGGDISQMKTFGNIVPTGLEVRGETIYMGEAGPILIVDVEFGPCDVLYALSQGIWDLPVIPENEGAPASADTGRLLRVTDDGSFATVVDGLDRPTSVEFVGRTAFVVTLTGKVMKIERA
jgi:hypothetical protein